MKMWELSRSVSTDWAAADSAMARPAIRVCIPIRRPISGTPLTLA